MKHINKIVQFILALNLMAIGIALYLKANIGIGSWDVLHGNLYKYYHLTFGTWVFIVGIVTILISQLFYYHISSFLAIFTGLVLGQLIDLWHDRIFLFELSLIHYQVILFFLSILLLGSGISLLVLTKLPPTPPDIFMISLMKRYKVNFLTAKSITEATVFFAALTVGLIHSRPFYNVGIGTLLTLLLIGSIVQISSKFWKKIFKFI